VLKLWDSTTEKSLLAEVQEINRTLKTMKDIALEKEKQQKSFPMASMATSEM
jgi:hypothetical protein